MPVSRPNSVSYSDPYCSPQKAAPARPQPKQPVDTLTTQPKVSTLSTPITPSCTAQAWKFLCWVLSGIWYVISCQWLCKKEAQKDHVVFGNVASLQDAEIICLPDVHYQKEEAQLIGKVINEHYRPGDVILVEGLQAGTSKKAGEFGFLTKFINKDYEVIGFEPEGAKEVGDRAFHKTKKIQDQFNADSDAVLKLIPEKDDFTEKDIEPLEAALDLFIKEKLSPVLEHVYKTPEERAKVARTFSKFRKDIFEEFRNKTLNQGSKTASNGLFLKIVFLRLISDEIEKQFGPAQYRHLTREEAEMLLDAGPARNVSIKAEITKHRNGKRRIFVIVGGAHLCRSKYISKRNDLSILDFLQQHKFAIVATNTFVQDHDVVRLNPSLRQISN